METTMPVTGSKARPAMSATMPEGSYLRKGAAGRIGNSMKSVQTAAAAQKSAVIAMRFVDQPPSFAVVEWVS